MILVLAVLGFFAIIVFGGLYFPRTYISIFAIYFFDRISGLPAAINVATPGSVFTPLIWIILVGLAICAIIFDIHKFQVNPFKD